MDFCGLDFLFYAKVLVYTEDIDNIDTIQLSTKENLVKLYNVLRSHYISHDEEYVKMQPKQRPDIPDWTSFECALQESKHNGKCIIYLSEKAKKVLKETEDIYKFEIHRLYSELQENFTSGSSKGNAYEQFVLSVLEYIETLDVQDFESVSQFQATPACSACGKPKFPQ